MLFKTFFFFGPQNVLLTFYNGLKSSFFFVYIVGGMTPKLSDCKAARENLKKTQNDANTIIQPRLKS